MPPTVPQHPSAADLAAFARGRLSPAAAEWVAQHLQECLACRTTTGIDPEVPSGAQTGRETETPPARESGTLVFAPSSPPVPADIPAALLDHPRYRIIRRLGVGGMGVVYQAEHKVMERLVAVKVISRSFMDRPDAVERFHREVRAAAKLDHPNIVKAYDAETAGDLQLLAMEYVEGRSLAEVVRKKGPLPIAHACNYVRQAALGLQHAFERGMVHRDLKPHNLMLTPKGQVKILDFGLAKLASEQSRLGVDLTQENMVMGTPEYMAPEQAANTKAADVRADIYALGCTLYCLLTGRPPFTGDNHLAIVVAHSQTEPRPVTELRPEAQAPLAECLSRLLAKNPNDRPQTPKEVADSLAPFAKASRSGVTTTAAVDSKRPEDTPTAFVPPPRRGRWLIPSGLALLALLGLGLWAGGVFRAESQADRPDEGPTVKADKPAPARSPQLDDLYQLSAELRLLTYPQNPARARTRQRALEETKAATTAIEAGAAVDDPQVAKHLDQVRKHVSDLKAVSTTFPVQKRALAEAERLLVAVTGKPASGGDFTSLFNGKDLTGWEPFPGGTAKWSVEDGAIVGRGGRGYLFSKRGDFADFRVQVEAKAGPGANSGVFFRMPYSIDPRTGYEAQIDAGIDPYPTGSLYGLVTGKRDLAPKADEWFTLEVIAVGPSIRVLVNGRPSVEFRDPKPRSLKGYFALQQQTPGKEIRFRKVEVKEIK